MKKIRIRSKNLFLTLFLAGFVLGVFYISVFGKTAVHSVSLMSSYFFSKYQQIEFLSEELFLYTLKSRLSTFTLLWLTGLTVLGSAASHLYLFWVGASLGITAATAAMKLGFQGILFCAVSGLPQGILYFPAFYWLLRKICDMSESREVKLRQWNGGKSLFYSYLLVWLLGAVIFSAGSFLESYVNPVFLKSFLKMI